MADPITALGVAIGSLEAAKTIADGIRATEKAYSEAELKAAAAELMIKLAEARASVGDVKSELAELKEELRKLRAREDIRAKLQRRGDYLYEVDDQGVPISYPFCERCLEVTGAPIRYVNDGLDADYTGQLKCPECGSRVFVAELKTKSRPRPGVKSQRKIR